jgi:ribosomal protein L11 methyltransferase
LLELAVYGDERLELEVRGVFAEAWAAPVENGWEERWRVFHRPVRAGGLWIGPPWEVAPAGERSIVIDPGQAFGTGAHATTRACLELLAGETCGRVLDAGCGSGVIAVAASRLGHAPVVAVDCDPLAVAATRANAARNAVELEVRMLDVLEDDLPEADLLVANIELRVVEAVLARCPAPRAITSGYLAHERVDASGWRALRVLELDGWRAELLARRRSPSRAEPVS